MGKRGVSPIIGTFVLIALMIAGLVVVYKLFYSSSAAVSSKPHAVIIDATLLSSTGVFSVNVKNDGIVAITEIPSCTIADLTLATTTSTSYSPPTSSEMPSTSVAAVTPSSCGTFVLPGGVLNPSESVAATSTIHDVSAGKSYIITVTVQAADGSTFTTSFNIMAGS